MSHQAASGGVGHSVRPPWSFRLATAVAVQLVASLSVIGLFPAHSISPETPSDNPVAATLTATSVISVVTQLIPDQQAEDQAAAKLAADQLAEEERKAAEIRASRTRTDSGWVCPVQGPHAFTDGFGDSRGRRRHQGNDIMAPRGTPVVASVAGTAKTHHSGLGGISYYLEGDDGNTYFGAHLDRLSGASGRVAAGTILGFVGSSGNASVSAPHLHFEIHPGGGGAVNPFPTLSRHC
jgi:murein DD-endopeptidase MepM/ murein hydrolase activator NlpD